MAPTVAEFVVVQAVQLVRIVVEPVGELARLLDVVVAVPIGSGRREDWTVTALHRTPIQTGHDLSPATAVLARLLGQLDVINAAGIITAGIHKARMTGRTQSPNRQ